MSNYYWLAQRRYVKNNRMSWHAEPADESFWYDYWHKVVNPAYYERAEKLDLAADEMGTILLAEMSSDGCHLEAGCGAGYWVAALRRVGLNVEGIEYSQELVTLVNEVYPQLPVRFGDALAIDRPDNTYDSYLSFGVVEHRREGPEPFLLEAFRVLKPSGKILITVPYLGPIRRAMSKLGRYEAEPPDLPFFQYAFTGKEFNSLLLRAGFEEIENRTIGVHRLLMEEAGLYRWLSKHRGGLIWKKAFQRLFHNQDGHMLVCIARKPTGVPARNEGV